MIKKNILYFFYLFISQISLFGMYFAGREWQEQVTANGCIKFDDSMEDVSPFRKYIIANIIEAKIENLKKERANYKKPFYLLSSKEINEIDSKKLFFNLKDNKEELCPFNLAKILLMEVNKEKAKSFLTQMSIDHYELFKKVKSILSTENNKEIYQLAGMITQLQFEYVEKNYKEIVLVMENVLNGNAKKDIVFIKKLSINQVLTILSHIKINNLVEIINYITVNNYLHCLKELVENVNFHDVLFLDILFFNDLKKTAKNEIINELIKKDKMCSILNYALFNNFEAFLIIFNTYVFLKCQSAERDLNKIIDNLEEKDALGILEEIRSKFKEHVFLTAALECTKQVIERKIILKQQFNFELLCKGNEELIRKYIDILVIDSDSFKDESIQDFMIIFKELSNKVKRELFSFLFTIDRKKACKLLNYLIICENYDYTNIVNLLNFIISLDPNKFLNLIFDDCFISLIKGKNIIMKNSIENIIKESINIHCTDLTKLSTMYCLLEQYFSNNPPVINILKGVEYILFEKADNLLERKCSNSDDIIIFILKFINKIITTFNDDHQEDFISNVVNDFKTSFDSCNNNYIDLIYLFSEKMYTLLSEEEFNYYFEHKNGIKMVDLRQIIASRDIQFFASQYASQDNSRKQGYTMGGIILLKLKDLLKDNSNKKNDKKYILLLEFIDFVQKTKGQINKEYLEEIMLNFKYFLNDEGNQSSSMKFCYDSFYEKQFINDDVEYNISYAINIFKKILILFFKNMIKLNKKTAIG